VDANQMMMELREQAERFGADIRDGEIIEADLTQRPYTFKTDGGETIEADSVIIATGAKAKYLGLADEEKYNGMGVSACATCDGFFYRKKVTAVVGGGDTACEDALYLSQLCQKVYLVVRKPYLRASEIMQQRVKEAENIEILFEHNATGLYGENGVEGMHLVKRKGEADEEHYDVAIDGFFLAIGHKPVTDIFQGKILLDEMGYIKTLGTSQQVCDTTGKAIPGVYAAGDVCDPVYRQAIVAAGSGCKAALDAEKYLQTI
jgi:thioredoxin reductase (NADPH)